jgi:hypothetical protein
MLKTIIFFASIMYYTVCDGQSVLNRVDTFFDSDGNIDAILPVNSSNLLDGYMPIRMKGCH